MHSKNQAVLDTGIRVEGFFTRREGELPKTSQSAVRRQLVIQVGILKNSGRRQTSEQIRSVGATGLKATMRELLFRKHLAPLVTMANALMPKNDEFKGIMLPNRNLGTGKLINAVEGIVEALTHHVDLFVEAGLDPDFLDQLIGAADAVKVAVDAGSSRRGGRINATSAVDVAGVQAGRLIRTIDRMVRAELDDNKPLLQEWKDAARIARGPKRVATPAASDDDATTEVIAQTA